MTPETRTSILFWCQVGLFVTAMVTLLGILAAFWFVLTSQMRAMDENRARDRAMLQQHQSALIDHDRAREQHDAQWLRTLHAFDAMLDKHRP